MNMEQKISGEKLDEDAAKRPDITNVVPLAALQDHFWPPVLPSVDDGALRIGLMSSTSKVDEFDSCALWNEVVLAVQVLLDHRLRT